MRLGRVSSFLFESQWVFAKLENMIIGGENSSAAPQGLRTSVIWPEFLHVVVKMKRAPSANRGSYAPLEPNLLGLHPEDEERENHCVLGHGAMPQQPLHLHQAVGPWAERGCGSALLMRSPIPNIFTLDIVQTPCLSGSKRRSWLPAPMQIV